MKRNVTGIGHKVNKVYVANSIVLLTLESALPQTVCGNVFYTKLKLNNFRE